MADVSITPTSVAPDTTVTDANKVRYTGSEQIEAGEWFYVNSTTGKAALAFHSGTVAQAAAVAMAVNTCEQDGQEVQGVVNGLVTIGTHGQALGSSFFLSTNGGKMAPDSDVGSGDYATFCCIVTSATQVFVSPVVSGVQKP